MRVTSVPKPAYAVAISTADDAAADDGEAVAGTSCALVASRLVHGVASRQARDVGEQRDRTRC